MARRRPPFENTKQGFRCNLDSDEIHLVRRLLGEVRELLTVTEPDDPKMLRLFPPAYDLEVDAEADAEFRRLMRDELVASRLESLSTIDEFLTSETEDSGSVRYMTEEQLHAMSKSLNSVRLILGTLMGISDDDEGGDPGANREPMALYHYLSWLLESAVDALSGGLDR